MNFKSQICTTREQSKRLLALGLKPETADMMPGPNGHPMCTPCMAETCVSFRNHCTPAWSLGRLLEMMPKSIGQVNRPNADLDVNSDGLYWFITYKELGYDVKHQEMKHDLFDAVISMISWLIAKEHFNSEYLKGGDL